MKTAICYYSRHHGNTLNVLEAMAGEGDVDLIDVTTRQTVRLEKYDCIGFASGIYGFEFQKAVVEFARQQPVPLGFYRIEPDENGELRARAIFCREPS